MIEEEWGNAQEQKPVVSNLPTSSIALPSSGKNTKIGFDEHLLRVMDELTRNESNLQILPLVGMGGTGKTTLARNIFDHPYVVHHFDKRIWFTISQEYSVHEILVRLLHDGKNEEVSETSAKLEEIGKDIAKACRGLPLTIVVIDGLLANSNMEQEYWKYVAKNVSDQVSLQEAIDVPEIVVGSRLTLGASGLVCEACKSMYPHLVRLRWTKVFGLPEGEYLQHTKLRCIEMTSFSLQNNTMDPFTTPLLWDLQTLVFTIALSLDPLVIPPIIWEMPQLRHIIISSAILPDPIDTKNSPVLENLQTLSFINDFKCTNEVLCRIPNLKKLKICYPSNVEDWSSYSLYNLVHLHKLESLYAVAIHLLLKNIVFPTSLKKLHLWDWKVSCEDMTIVGSLPNLEAVLFARCAFEGLEWNPIEGQFPRLKILELSGSNLVYWSRENVHFPNLEILSLHLMYDLEEIPSGIGDIATLRLIEVHKCSESIVKSAIQILEEQQSNGNEDLQLRVR
ncbi:UNVERIFIED_CONTAM: putative late blight resistance proteinR1A-10 [Sesamum calycinum]|uniref:Late blight resistance proteinR1A-10 n=1 Tax=Sesamum calycinum TaxID=2727403 RepID=A0AAW2NDA8_9LAMI